jgi:Cd2+/Zn2+-exporting ATPase
MLTGDNEKTAKAIADEVGIADFRAGLFPEEKLAIIRELQQSGEAVAMLGDGVNDAPALTLSDVGISMGVIGTDIAEESSGISLMTDNLKLLPRLIRASKRTMRIVKQNIVIFAVLVNVIGIWLSATGFLTPILAAVVHNLSSVFVVLNSARLLRFRYAV